MSIRPLTRTSNLSLPHHLHLPVVLITIEIAQYIDPARQHTIEGLRLSYNGTALLGYLVTAYLSGLLAHALGPRRRMWLVASNVYQVVAVAFGLGISWAGVLESNHWALLLVSGPPLHY